MIENKLIPLFNNNYTLIKEQTPPVLTFISKEWGWKIINIFIYQGDFYIPPLFLGIGGGLSDFLMNDKHSTKLLITSLFLSGLVGYLTYSTCRSYKIDVHVTGVITFLAGFSSKRILLLMQRNSIKFANIFLSRKVSSWIKTVMTESDDGIDDEV